MTVIDSPSIPARWAHLPVIGRPSEPGVTSVGFMLDFAEQHGSVFVRMTPTGASLVVGEFDTASPVFDDTHFQKYLGAGLQLLRIVGGDGLFTAHTDERNWALAHGLLGTAFSGAAMRGYHDTMVTVARRLIAKWDGDVRSEGFVPDVTADMTSAALDAIGLTAFGFDFASFSGDEPQPVAASLATLFDGFAQIATIAPTLSMANSPALQPYWDRITAPSAHIAQSMDAVIAERRSAPKQPHHDLLSLMLDDPEQRLDDQNIRYQVINFMVAGHETTSGAMAFALHYLARYPEWQERLREQADTLWGDAEDVAPTVDDIRSLSVARDIVYETLRLWPTAPIVYRKALHDITLSHGVEIKSGEVVTLAIPLLHRDPVWGDAPEAFDPSRFASDRQPPLQAFRPFGVGERACIGMQFATHEAMLVLALLVHRYDITLPDDSPLTITQSLTLKPAPYRVALRRRSAQEKARRTSASGTTANVTVGYGSNLGTARNYALRLVDEFAAKGIAARACELNTLVDAMPGGPLVVVASSYNGCPTDDADQFLDWLADSAEHGRVLATRYAVIGVGDSGWTSTFGRVPTRISELLTKLGARELMPMALLDCAGDPEPSFAAATRGLRDLLAELLGSGTVTATTPRLTVTEHAAATATIHARHAVVPLSVLATRSLDANRRAVTFATSGYRTGDYLSVLPTNDGALVEQTARALGVNLDAMLSFTTPGTRFPDDRPLTGRELLTHYLELTAPLTDTARQILADLNPCPPDRAALAITAGSIMELAQRFPALTGRVDWTTLCEIVPPLRPRLYSLATSGTLSPEQAEIFVSASGLTSRYLHRVQPGDTVAAAIVPGRAALRIRHSDLTPIVFLAAGTGIAPFRAAFTERAALGDQALAPALCYYGSGHPDADILYRDELRELADAARVELRPAFRREGTSVEAHLLADQDRLGALIDARARFAVCGSAIKLAEPVRRAARLIHQRHAGATPDESAAWFTDLCVSGRWVEDVY